MGGRKILIDPGAESSNADEPAFIARPACAPVYHGFQIVEESETDGWRIGAITDFVGEEAGDAFVIAPDGSRAGLVWAIGPGELETVMEPDKDRWGVYAVWFSTPIKDTNDLVKNFRQILPDLKRKFEDIKRGA